MNEMTQSVMTKNLMIILEFSVFQITLNPSICSADQSFIMDIDKEDEQIDTNYDICVFVDSKHCLFRLTPKLKIPNISKMLLMCTFLNIIFHIRVIPQVR